MQSASIILFHAVSAAIPGIGHSRRPERVPLPD